MSKLLERAMNQIVAPAKLLLAGLLLAASASTALGQAATTGHPGANDPTLKLSPTTLLQRFEPPANEEYSLGPGDEISLDFPGRPELNAKKVVGPDGRITL